MRDRVWACLLRGVNVGGLVLRMEDFPSLLAGLGCAQIQTLIQSGNALFTLAGRAGDPAALEGQPFDPGLGGDNIYLTLASGPMDPVRLAGLQAMTRNLNTMKRLLDLAGGMEGAS